MKKKKDVFLIIQTTQRDKIIIGLAKNDCLISHSVFRRGVERHSERLVFAIDKLLKKNKIKPAELAGLFVVKGPGSYTSLKTGCAVANAFAFVLKIPALGFKQKEFNDFQELARIAFKKYQKIKNKKQPKFVFPFYGELAYYER